jgi:hypothetical protein
MFFQIIPPYPTIFADRGEIKCLKLKVGEAVIA